MGNAVAPPLAQDKKYVKAKEFVLYLFAVFFYTNMTGMIGSYRSAYLVNVLSWIKTRSRSLTCL
ncbi:unknown [Clostridium sp. CAG:678]|nr:unknown [Clostridium sp. CAG:678]